MLKTLEKTKVLNGRGGGGGFWDNLKQYINKLRHFGRPQTTDGKELVFVLSGN